MSTIWLILSILIALITFNFFYWVNLKEDYITTKIFTSALVIWVLTFVFSLVPLLLYSNISDSTIFSKSGIWYWGGTIGFLLGILISKWRFDFKLNESFEAAINGLWVFFLILSIVVFPLGILIFGLLLIVYYLIKHNYKKFTFYRSGKIGVASIVTVGLFFIIRAVVAIFFNAHMLSLIGKIDGILSSIFVFISFVALYYLTYEQKK